MLADLVPRPTGPHVRQPIATRLRVRIGENLHRLRVLELTRQRGDAAVDFRAGAVCTNLGVHRKREVDRRRVLRQLNDVAGRREYENFVLIQVELQELEELVRVFRVELELAGSLPEATGTRAQLTDGFINWNRFEFAQIRVGQFKIPFGFEQLASDPRLASIERTLVNDRLTAGRQIGLQLGGDLFDKKTSYATGLFNGTGLNTSANDNDQFLWAGRISVTGWQGNVLGHATKWNVGANALTTRDSNLPNQPAEFRLDLVPGGTVDNIFAGRRRAAGLDTQLHAGPFDLWAEYLRARFEPLDRIPSASFDAGGWYIQAAFFALPQTLQAVVKYDVFNPDLGIARDGLKAAAEKTMHERGLAYNPRPVSKSAEIESILMAAW